MDIHGQVNLSKWAHFASIEGEVRLEDCSLIDAPSVVVARAPVLRSASGDNGRFALHIDDERLREGGRFILSADLIARDKHGAQQRLGTVQSYPWSKGVEAVAIDVDVWT